jgi:hypothetical protein
MAALTPQFEIGKDVQFFLTPMTDSGGTWAAVGPTFALQVRVEDVQITPAYQSQSISPMHLFNANPVIFEGGCSVSLSESRIANTNVASGSIALPRGNVLEAAALLSFTHKLEIKRYNKGGTEITAQKITILFQMSEQPTSHTKSGNTATMSGSTIAVLDSSTGAELSNPYYGASAPF